jgi:uncharacterized Zn finger protein (UPF0148 family)
MLETLLSLSLPIATVWYILYLLNGMKVIHCSRCRAQIQNYIREKGSEFCPWCDQRPEKPKGRAHKAYTVIKERSNKWKEKTPNDVLQKRVERVVVSGSTERT